MVGQRALNISGSASRVGTQVYSNETPSAGSSKRYTDSAPATKMRSFSTRPKSPRNAMLSRT